MKSNTKKVLAALAFLFAGSNVSAAIIFTSTYGDVDGYAQTGGYTGTITDTYVGGSQSWKQTLIVSGVIKSATIEVGYAALGYYPPAVVPRLFVDGKLVGNLKDMDGCDGSAAPGVSGCGLTNYTTQLLSISDFSTFTDGIANIMIETSSGDSWILDYSKLTVTAVPEPSSVALLGLGLFGFAAARRKSVKK